MTNAEKTNHNDFQLFILTELLNLQDRVRGITLQELRFTIANETFNIIQYDTAILWEYPENAAPKITALSGVSEVDKQNKYAQFLKQLHKTTLTNHAEINEQSLEGCQDPALKKEWQSFLPSNLCYIPLKSYNGETIAALVLARKTRFKSGDKAIFEKLSTIYGHEISSRTQTKTNFTLMRKALSMKHSRLLAFIVLAIILLWPVRTSTLAPAEIIAQAPDLIRAPLDGIVKDIHVKPNQNVKQGEPLITFDDAALIAQQKFSRNALTSAQAQLRQVAQEALSSTTARSKLNALKAQVEKEKTNLEYYNTLLERALIKAPKDGAVIFEDTFDWLGRPVKIGERIMLLADANKTDLEIHLPVKNTIPLLEKTDILFFSNAAPDKPINATLSFHSYRATQTNENELAYRLKAKWGDSQNNQNIRLGMKGTAKIYGKRQPLIWQILRVPLMKIRQWSGL